MTLSFCELWGADDSGHVDITIIEDIHLQFTSKNIFSYSFQRCDIRLQIQNIVCFYVCPKSNSLFLIKFIEKKLQHLISFVKSTMIFLFECNDKSLPFNSIKKKIVLYIEWEKGPRTKRLTK